jgi:hypothetical protein
VEDLLAIGKCKTTKRMGLIFAAQIVLLKMKKIKMFGKDLFNFIGKICNKSTKSLLT